MNPKKVAVIIPHYSEDKRYLNQCIQSLLKQSHLGVDIYVSSSSPTRPDLHEKVKVIHSSERMHYAKAINTGVRTAMAFGQYDYFIFGNDDTIYSRTAIENLVSEQARLKKALGGEVILNALSNCDNGLSFSADIVLSKDGETLVLESSMTYDQVKEHIDLIESAPGGAKFFMPTEMVCMYATMIPSQVLHKIGLLDERFVTAGWEDKDLCLRARKEMGILCGITLHSFIFHFSGRTSSLVTTQQERDDNRNYFREKWSV